MTIQPPEQRRWKLIGKFEADTWEDLCDHLYNLADELRRRQEGESPSYVIGGYSYGSIFTITEKPDMTHDRYFEELDIYLAAEKEKNRAGDNENPGLPATSGKEDSEVASSG